MRAEFESFRAATARREAELCAEIATLRLSRQAPVQPDETETLVAPAHIAEKTSHAEPESKAGALGAEPRALPSTNAVPMMAAGAEPLVPVVGDDDDDDGEQSMDLGTPLRPTMALQNGETIHMVFIPVDEEPAANDIAVTDPPQSQPVDPAMIALPDTPTPVSRSSSPSSLRISGLAASDRAAIIRERPPTPFELPSSPSAGANEDAGVEGDISRNDESVIEVVQDSELVADDDQPFQRPESARGESPRTDEKAEQAGADVGTQDVVAQDAELRRES